jgi:hypothetical protein
MAHPARPELIKGLVVGSAGVLALIGALVSGDILDLVEGGDEVTPPSHIRAAEDDRVACEKVLLLIDLQDNRLLFEEGQARRGTRDLPRLTSLGEEAVSEAFASAARAKTGALRDNMRVVVKAIRSDVLNLPIPQFEALAMQCRALGLDLRFTTTEFTVSGSSRVQTWVLSSHANDGTLLIPSPSTDGFRFVESTRE